MERQNPLGPEFLGHKTDLDELCLFLAEEVRPRVKKDAVLHILIPTIGPLAIPEAIRFPEDMRPFQVEGQLGHDGTPLVWICAPDLTDQRSLHGIGILKQREIRVMKGAVGVLLPFVERYLSMQTGTQYFVNPLYRVGTSISSIFTGGVYRCCGLEPPRILGRPSYRPWA